MKFLFSILIFIIFSQFSFATQVDSLIHFDLNDQFGKNHSREDFNNTIIILIGSDKEGSQYNEEWITAIVDSLDYKMGWTNLVFMGVADLRGVPFFLKPFVPGFFPDDKNQWVLMDWEGAFAKEYKFKEDFCNILIFNRKGQKLYQVPVKNLQKLELNNLLSIIRATLKEE